MADTLKSLRGMHDVLPAQSAAWQYLEQHVRDLMQSYCFEEIRTPLLEQTALFSRSIGDVTDIVEKEMYTFADRNGESISLRPENTASCIRSAIEHGLLQPGQVSRLWYQGTMFRYERPQKGRYRQFVQFGAEVYGIPGPQIEAELILLSANLWRRLGLDREMHLEINTLGTADERTHYREQLVAYLRDYSDALDADSQRRLESNPLRILDSKNPAMQAVLAEAPTLLDTLGDESREHFDGLQTLLRGFDIDVRVNTRLVRGLDYYSHTVFEWVTDRLGAQGTCCAGGRYDGLTEQLGGKLTPAVGWAIGAERILALLEETQGVPVRAVADVYVVMGGGVAAESGLQLAEELRTQLPGAGVICHAGGGSMKSQFKKADKSGAQCALVLGEQELADGTVTVKFLRQQSEQQTMARAGLAQFIQSAIQTDGV